MQDFLQNEETSEQTVCRLEKTLEVLCTGLHESRLGYQAVVVLRHNNHLAVGSYGLNPAETLEVLEQVVENMRTQFAAEALSGPTETC